MKQPLQAKSLTLPSMHVASTSSRCHPLLVSCRWVTVRYCPATFTEGLAVQSQGWAWATVCASWGHGLEQGWLESLLSGYRCKCPVFFQTQHGFSSPCLPADALVAFGGAVAAPLWSGTHWAPGGRALLNPQPPMPARLGEKLGGSTRSPWCSRLTSSSCGKWG